MQLFLSFLKGMLIGLMTGFPAGPLGAIAIREMVGGEVHKGFEKGMGAVLANFLYGIIIIFGLSFLADFLLQSQLPIRLVGSLIIILLGIKILSNPGRGRAKQPPPAPRLMGTSFLTGFVIAATNPAKLIMYTGVISYMGLESLNNGFSTASLLLVLGIACGSFTWWLLLALGAHKLVNRFGSRRSHKLNLFFGSLIIILGLVFLLMSIPF